ncbi:MAG: hypothetical protein R3C11_23540 [Planctomycetaceae bacterium]
MGLLPDYSDLLPGFGRTLGNTSVDGSDWKRPPSYYAYDVDADGDGTKEAIWMDLDFPIQETPDGGRFFVPMFGVTIYDASV